MTEYTDNIDGRGGAWLLYDGGCRLCTRLARRIAGIVRPHGIVTLPIQHPAAVRRLKLRTDRPPEEMILITADGRTFGGADAAVELARSIWWARPLAWLGGLPVIRPPLHRFYRLIARNRHCLAGRCSLARPNLGRKGVMR